MSAKLRELRKMLKSHKTFYTKQWQSNGYYPIDKFVWNEDENEYWVSSYKTKPLSPTHWVGGIEGLLYVLTHNGYIISEGEFKNTKECSAEGLPLVWGQP